jgi:hypothetical protein
VDGESRSRGDLGEYVCGGYFITKVARSYRKSDLVPDGIRTVSPCIARTLPPPDWTFKAMGVNDRPPPDWTFKPIEMAEQEREEAALNYGIDLSNMARLITWIAERVSRMEIGIPNQFSSRKTADDLLRAFTFDRNDWRLVAIGLRREQVQGFLADIESSSPKGPVPFCVHEAISRREALDPAGRIIGFDVLGMDGYGGECHSWLCNSLEEPIAAQLGIRAGAYGLLPTWSQADACAEYASRPEVGAEPLPWYAWAVISYPI